MLFVLIFIIVALAAALWAVGVWYINDFSVPPHRLESIKKVLVVFPHADDETNVAGLLWLCRQRGINVTFVVLTRGENGTADAHQDLRLKAIRAAEMRRVAHRLGAGKLIQEDFGDGALATKRAQLRQYADKLLDDEQPDLVITYDRAGLYGHEDHMICTEVITEALQQYPATQLWYNVWPKRLLAVTHLPTHMAKDTAFEQMRGKPNLRMFIGAGLCAKIASVYSHTSQRRSFRSMMPLHLPVWLVYSLQIFEYYERVD